MLTLQVARRVDPRKLALVLGAIWCFFAANGLAIGRGYGAYNLQTFSLHDSDLASRIGNAPLLTSILLFWVAAAAHALACSDRPRNATRWRLAGWASLALGLEELLGGHTWLQDLGVRWAPSYLPLLAFGLFAMLAVLPMLRHQPRTQATWGAALVVWLIAGVSDNSSLPVSNSTTELVEMAAAILFSIVVLERLRHLARNYYPLDEEATRLSLDEIGASALNRIPFRRVGIAIGVVISVLALQYVLLHRGNYHDAERLAILDLNNEQTLPDVFQASLLVAAGGLALLIGKLESAPVRGRHWWLLLGAVLIPLGFEQVTAIHSRFQDATGLPGQLVLMPIALFGVIAWLKVLPQMSGHRLARALFIAGAAAWVLSQGSDVLLNPVDALRWTITPEETLESIGSALWMFSLAIWLRDTLNVQPVELVEAEAGYFAYSASKTSA